MALTQKNGSVILFPMRLTLLTVGLLVWTVLQTTVSAQGGAEPGDPMRIAILVDNSQLLIDPLPFIRRGLQQFLNALPPNHELMLVTTGGQMNMRVEPTRDYLDVLESVNSIQVARGSGNALMGSVEQIHSRFLRGLERRFPVMVIVASDGPDASQRITNEGANALLRGMRNSGVLVNGVMLNPTGSSGMAGSSQIRSFMLEMIERSGGALETASAPTAPAKLKTLAGRIAQQYKQLSPDKMPSPEFRR
jgi:hypothetical protein